MVETKFIKFQNNYYHQQRWSWGHARLEAKDTKKKSEAKAKDSPIKVRPSRGQGQECSTPRTQAQLLSEKKVVRKIYQAISKKRSSKKLSRWSPEKNVFQKIFQALNKLLPTQKLVPFSNRGQGNFRGLEATRPKTSKCVLEDISVARAGGSGPGPPQLKYHQW